MGGYEKIEGGGDAARVFGDKMRESGALLEGEPLLDGRWHRTRVATDSGKKMSGTYRGFADGRPNCIFLNKKTGESYRWKLSLKTLSQGVSRRQGASGNLAAERKAVAAAAAKTAYGVWSNSPEWANQNNSGYLKAKGVKSYGIKIDREGKTLIPLRDVAGRLHSLQFIGADGQDKMFLKGGQTSGMMYLIDPEHKIAAGARIVIAEGYATAASVYEASKLPVAVAFNANNLEKVAVALHGKYPEARFIIAADNDHKHAQSPQGNVGLLHAREAAKAVGGRVMAPDFNESEKALGLTDWNDMHQSRGLTATRAAMQEAIKRENLERGVTKRTVQYNMGMGM